VIANAPLWRELKASYALVERNVHLSKRYWGWELAFLVYTIAQSLAIVYTADAVPSITGQHIDTHRIVLYLAIGTLTWSYMASLFNAIAESVQWERWEGTIEYSMMAPISHLTYILGSCLFGVIYGLGRTAFVLLALGLMFHLQANPAGLLPALVVVGVGSVSFVGIGIMASTLPLLFTEKGAQMTYVIEACLLLVSGVYYPVNVLPIWMQPVSHLSPATYILTGIRELPLPPLSWSKPSYH
jgi:ABC-2 type transport system permease protein